MKKFLQNKKGRYSFRQSKRGARCPKDFCKCLISFSPPPGMDVEHTPWRGWGWGGSCLFYCSILFILYLFSVLCFQSQLYVSVFLLSLKDVSKERRNFCLSN